MTTTEGTEMTLHVEFAGRIDRLTDAYIIVRPVESMFGVEYSTSDPTREPVGRGLYSNLETAIDVARQTGASLRADAAWMARA